MAEDWSREEVEAVVADYLAMLASELGGEPYNKAAHNRALQRVLGRRTHGSIERKHQNISAVLIELGFPYIEGYKPLGNYQDLLRSVIEHRLDGERRLQEIVATAVVATPTAPRLPSDLLTIEVPAPAGVEDSYAFRDRAPRRQPSAKRDYLAIEARNTSLGLEGERLVLRFEHERLWRAGQRTLADRIEHVSQTRGDGLGYDILSYETDGRERFVEVKTTRFGEMTPFFVSRNEVRSSGEIGDQYQLCRVFAFAREPRLFTLAGPLDHTCRLDPVEFVGVPRSRGASPGSSPP
ncbi:MAG: DUF3883 domain-containing protein [Verrucomicrobiae bacterium]|nr:DUF3883 domain-containing protein [Verrucomicrobiae bacterium]